MGGYFSYPAKAQVALEPNQVAEPTNTITEPPVATEVVTATAEVMEVAEPTNIINESPQDAEVAEPIQNPNIVADPPQVAEAANVAEVVAEPIQNPNIVADRVESGDKSRRFQSLAASPDLKYDSNHGSPTALAVGKSHNLSSFSSLVAETQKKSKKAKKSKNAHPK